MATAVKKKKEIDSILIRGIRIYPNTIYKVGDKKPSGGAPEIYKDLESEKASAPLGVIKNIVGIPMINGSWDTGFYPTSAIFKDMGLSPDKAEIRCEEYREFILEPLRRAGLKKLIEDLENHEDPDNPFFLDLTIPLTKGAQFNTGDARSRLALYIAIISGELAPEGKATKEQKAEGILNESDSVYAGAQYTINSDTHNRSVKEKREYANNKARGIFFNLMESDKDLLVSLLNYEGINATVDTPEYTLSTIISKYFESYDNVDSFLEIYEKSKSDSNFKEELRIMGILLNEKGLRYLEKDGQTYLLKGQDLGTNMKSVARTIANSSTLRVEFFNLLEV